MPDTLSAMREFRFLSDKRNAGGLSDTEEGRFQELAGQLQQAPEPVAEAAPTDPVAYAQSLVAQGYDPVQAFLYAGFNLEQIAAAGYDVSHYAAQAQAQEQAPVSASDPSGAEQAYDPHAYAQSLLAQGYDAATAYSAAGLPVPEAAPVEAAPVEPPHEHLDFADADLVEEGGAHHFDGTGGWKASSPAQPAPLEAAPAPVAGLEEWRTPAPPPRAVPEPVAVPHIDTAPELAAGWEPAPALQQAASTGWDPPPVDASAVAEVEAEPVSSAVELAASAVASEPVPSPFDPTPTGASDPSGAAPASWEAAPAAGWEPTPVSASDPSGAEAAAPAWEEAPSEEPVLDAAAIATPEAEPVLDAAAISVADPASSADAWAQPAPEPSWDAPAPEAAPVSASDPSGAEPAWDAAPVSASDPSGAEGAVLDAAAIATPEVEPVLDAAAIAAPEAEAQPVLDAAAVVEAEPVLEVAPEPAPLEAAPEAQPEWGADASWEAPLSVSEPAGVEAAAPISVMGAPEDLAPAIAGMREVDLSSAPGAEEPLELGTHGEVAAPADMAFTTARDIDLAAEPEPVAEVDPRGTTEPGNDSWAPPAPPEPASWDVAASAEEPVLDAAAVAAPEEPVLDAAAIGEPVLDAAAVAAPEEPVLDAAAVGEPAWDAQAPAPAGEPAPAAETPFGTNSSDWSADPATHDASWGNNATDWQHHVNGAAPAEAPHANGAAAAPPPEGGPAWPTRSELSEWNSPDKGEYAAWSQSAGGVVPYAEGEATAEPGAPAAPEAQLGEAPVSASDPSGAGYLGAEEELQVHADAPVSASDPSGAAQQLFDHGALPAAEPEWDAQPVSASDPSGAPAPAQAAPAEWEPEPAWDAPAPAAPAPVIEPAPEWEAAPEVVEEAVLDVAEVVEEAPAAPPAPPKPKLVITSPYKPPPPPQPKVVIDAGLAEENVLIDESAFDPGQPRAAAPAPTKLTGERKVIVHLTEGAVKRGAVVDLDLGAPAVVLLSQTGITETIPRDRVKAIFFMLAAGAPAPAVEGSKLRITFTDGRQIVGFASSYDPQAPGFFIVPADARTNTDRIWVYRTAVRSVAQG